MQRNEDHPENRIFKSKIWKTHTKKSWKKKDTTANGNSRERPAARAIREEEKKEDVDSN